MISDAAAKTYHEYLQSRSLLGLAYRKWFLYPFINRQLNGAAVDIGCGIGDFLKFRTGTVGIDINRYNVEYCRSNGLASEWIEKDTFPFPDEKFDSALCDNVLEHLADPASLLTESRRVLKRGGTLVVGVPGELGWKHDADHKVFYDLPKLRSTLEPRGFVFVRCLQLPLPFAFLSPIFPYYCIYAVFTKGPTEAK